MLMNCPRISVTAAHGSRAMEGSPPPPATDRSCQVIPLRPSGSPSDSLPFTTPRSCPGLQRRWDGPVRSPRVPRRVAQPSLSLRLLPFFLACGCIVFFDSWKSLVARCPFPAQEKTNERAHDGTCVRPEMEMVWC